MAWKVTLLVCLFLVLSLSEKSQAYTVAISSGGHSAVGFNASLEAVFNAMNEWGSISGSRLSFTYMGAFPKGSPQLTWKAQGAADIRILFDEDCSDKPGWAGYTGHSQRGVVDADIHICAQYGDPVGFRFTLLHEFGHALTFAHSEDESDVSFCQASAGCQVGDSVLSRYVSYERMYRGLGEYDRRIARYYYPDLASSITPVGRSYQWITAPLLRYGDRGGELMNKNRANPADHSDPEWVGVSDHAELVVDYGKVKSVEKVKIRMLKNLNHGIDFPTHFKLECSRDGQRYDRMISNGDFVGTVVNGSYEASTLVSRDFSTPQRCRYIRVNLWHAGKTLFLSELIAN